MAVKGPLAAGRTPRTHARQLDYHLPLSDQVSGVILFELEGSSRATTFVAGLFSQIACESLHKVPVVDDDTW